MPEKKLKAILESGKWPIDSYGIGLVLYPLLKYWEEDFFVDNFCKIKKRSRQNGRYNYSCFGI